MNKQTVTPQVFEGTVNDLAGKMTLNGEVLSLQDVQFLTRIGRDIFAEPIGTQRSAGERGGKRATIWRIKPAIKFSLEQATKHRAKAATKAPVQKMAAAAVNDQSPEFQAAVEKAVKARMKDQSKPAKTANAVAGDTIKRRPGRPVGSKNKVQTAAA